MIDELRERAHRTLIEEEAALLRQLIGGQESRAAVCDQLISVYTALREIDDRVSRSRDDAYVI